MVNPEVIRPREKPLAECGGTAVLYGNLCPDGAVIKTSAASPHLLQHTGPAVVFKDYNDMDARINREDLNVTADSVLVLQNAGPLGGPGMPEWGMLPIPKKLLPAGVRDMVRISDARMSGTSYGTCVLHVSPESFIGGPLALVQEGDLDFARCGEPATGPSGVERRTGRAPRSWVKPAPKFAARIYGALCGACHASASGMRFRLLWKARL